MPAVVVDSSVLISLAAGEVFHLLRDFYSTIYIPPEVWQEVISSPKPFGLKETQQAATDGWLIVQKPQTSRQIDDLPFSLDRGEAEALALALEFPESLLLVDDFQGRRAAKILGIKFTGTLGVLLRAKSEGKIAALRPILELLGQRTKFWLSSAVYDTALKQAGE